MNQLFTAANPIHCNLTRLSVSGKGTRLGFRLFCLLLSLTLGLSEAMATDYYVSNRGNDSNPGNTVSRPWRSLLKVEKEISKLKPGDRVLFERGGRFAGTLKLNNIQGRPGAPITLGAYGSGKDPVITGGMRVGDWKQHSGKIWKAKCANCPSVLNAVYLDDEILPMGRYPNVDAANKGYLTIDQTQQDKKIIVDKALSGKFSNNYWKGADVVVRTKRWILDIATIASHSGGTITLRNPLTYGVIKDYGYFIQNSYKTLDKDREWYYDPSTATLYVYLDGINPNNHVIEVASQSILFNITSSDHITIQNLRFEKSRSESIKAYGSKNISIIKNQLLNAGRNAVLARLCDNFLFQENTINNTNNNALDYRGNHGKFIDNRIHNTAMNAGMGAGGNGQYKCVHLNGNNILFQYNEIVNAGYVGIQFNGNSNHIKNNLVSYVCMVKDDGAGIYTFDNQGKNNEVTDNIVLHAKGVPEGTNDPSYNTARGLYTDGGTSGVLLKGNTVAYCGGGVMLHVSRNISVADNILFANQDHTLKVVYHAYTNLPETKGLSITNNILYNGNPAKELYNIVSHTKNAKGFGVIDQNVLLEPVQDTYPGSSYAMLLAENTKYPTGNNMAVSNYTIGGSSLSPYGNTDRESPVFHQKYTVKEKVSNNLLKNSTMNQSLSSGDWVKSPGNYAAFKVTQDQGNVIEGNSLKASFSSATGTKKGYVVQKNISLQGGAYYSISFDIKGQKQVILPFKVAASDGATPFVVKYFNVDQNTKKYTYIFQAKTTTKKGTVSFEFSPENGAVWFDNIEMYKVKVEETKESDVVRLEYNASKQSRQLSLDGVYYTATGEKVSGKVTIAPYKSLVLIRATDEVPASDPEAPKAPAPIVKTGELPWQENFDLANGSTADDGKKGGTAWALEKKNTGSNAIFEVRNSQLVARGTVNEAVWRSEQIKLNGKEVSLSVNVSSKGQLEMGYDYVKVFYRLNNGQEKLAGTVKGTVTGTRKISLHGIKGNILQIVVKIKNSDISEHYLIDNIHVALPSGESNTAPSAGNLPWKEDFNTANGKYKGSLEKTKVFKNAIIKIDHGKLAARGVGEIAYKTEVINLAGNTVDFSLALSSKGQLETGHDHVKVYYRLNHGKEVLAADLKGSIKGNKTVAVKGLKGQYLQIVVRIKNSDISEQYFIDDISVNVAGANMRIAGTEKQMNADERVPEAIAPSHDEIWLHRGVEIYPNPIIDFVEVKVNSDEQGSALMSITDLTGKLIYELHIPVNELISIDFSNFQAGVYICKIMDQAGGLQTYRIIKQ